VISFPFRFSFPKEERRKKENSMPVIKLFANLRKVVGTKETSVAGASLGEVLFELVKRNPALEDILLENGQIRQHVIITINGHLTADLEAPLQEQDVLAIFPPIAGG
jgi:molybdopterin synthase sulfur carrier subunit